MSFLYVDRIFEIDSKKSASGIKNVTRGEPFFYRLPTGQRVLSPAVVTEALAQLGAFLKMHSTDFTKRPVLLADEFTYYTGWAEAGDQIELNVKILDIDDDVIVSQSVAKVDGNKILEATCCRGYMLPMEEFDDRENVLRQYENLYRPELKDQFTTSTKDRILTPDEPSLRAKDSIRFADGLLEHVPYQKVVGFKNFSSCEPFFATHFPYKPVVPGVLLMTFMGEVCQSLIQENIEKPDRTKVLVPTFVRNARFRKFVEPGDQCVLTAEIKEGHGDVDDSDIVVSAVMMANNKRVMQAEMGFRTMFGSSSNALKRENLISD